MYTFLLQNSALWDMETGPLWVLGSSYIEASFPKTIWITGMIQGLHPTNERRCYKVTPSLIGWAQT